eukprot:superscaffoldBa00008982_g23770
MQAVGGKLVPVLLGPGTFRGMDRAPPFPHSVGAASTSVRGISRLSLAGILDRSAQQISKMSMRDGEGGWTVVNHRRGCKKSHVYAGPPDETSRSRNNSSLDPKHTYAYVTRTGRSMIRGYVQHHYREPGYKPKFFDSRTQPGPAKQSYKNTNMKYTNKLTKLPAGDWRSPFEVASSWAERNLGRRLKFDTLEQVEALLIDRLADLQPITPNTVVDGQPRQTEVERPAATAAARPPPPSLAAPLTTQAQIHTRKQGQQQHDTGDRGPLTAPRPPHT